MARSRHGGRWLGDNDPVTERSPDAVAAADRTAAGPEAAGLAEAFGALGLV